MKKEKKQQRRSSLLSAFRDVYRTPSSFVITGSVAVLIMVLNVIIPNFSLYIGGSSFPVLWQVFLGTFETVSTFFIVTLLLSSLLAGIVASLLVYHLRYLKSSAPAGAQGFGGVIIGAIAPTCPSCGIGLAAALGFGGFFASLPFGGREVSVIGILLLVLATFSLAKKISVKTCRAD